MVSKAMPFNCHSLHLLPSHADRSLTFKERLSSMSSKNVPNATFKINLQMPNVGVVGRTLPIFLSVEHMPESSTAPASPTVLLKSVSVSVLSMGSVRCIDSNLFSFGGDRLDSWDDKIEIASLDLRNTPAPLPEFSKTSMDLRDSMNLKISDNNSLLRSHLVPSYSTFNLEVHYMLRVKVAVECAQRKFQAEFFSRSFELLPGEWDGNPNDAAQASSSRSTNAPTYQESHTSEPLPPYAENPELWTPAGRPSKVDGAYGSES